MIQEIAELENTLEEKKKALVLLVQKALDYYNLKRRELDGEFRSSLATPSYDYNNIRFNYTVRIDDTYIVMYCPSGYDVYSNAYFQIPLGFLDNECNVDKEFIDGYIKCFVDEHRDRIEEQRIKLEKRKEARARIFRGETS